MPRGSAAGTCEGSAAHLVSMMTVAFRCRLIDVVRELQHGEPVDRREWLRNDEHVIYIALEPQRLILQQGVR